MAERSVPRIIRCTQPHKEVCCSEAGAIEVNKQAMHVVQKQERNYNKSKKFQIYFTTWKHF